jgi:hypothetical protein
LAVGLRIVPLELQPPSEVDAGPQPAGVEAVGDPAAASLGVGLELEPGPGAQV